MEKWPQPGDLVVLEDDGYDHNGDVLSPIEPAESHTICAETTSAGIKCWSPGSQKFVYLDDGRTRFFQTGPNHWTARAPFDGIFFVRRG